ncbi:hypothetical protein Tco_0740454 [Tanacetum coccineum]
MKAIKKVLRYVKGTKDYGITYKHNGGNKIYGYSDSSYGVNTQEGKGIRNNIQTMENTKLLEALRNKPTVALSSCDRNSSQQQQLRRNALWLKRLSADSHMEEERLLYWLTINQP